VSGPVSEPRRRREDGSIAVVTALLLVVFLGATAIAVDLGSAWSTRQDVITDVDAAALAAARAFEADRLYGNTWYNSGNGHPTPFHKCGEAAGSPSMRELVVNEARAVLQANRGASALGEVTIYCPNRTVTVTARQTAQGVAADDVTAEVRAVARAVEREGGDLMPVALCLDTPGIQEFLAAADPVGMQRTLPFESAPTEEKCGQASAPNWGWWGASNTETLRSWARQIVPSGVDVSLPPDTSCSGPAQPTSEHCVGDTGLRSSALAYGGLRTRECPMSLALERCQVVTFVVFDELICSGPDGSNCASGAEYRPYAFLDAIVRGVQPNTPAASITLEFRAWRDDPDDPPTGQITSYLCDVDGTPDDHDACEG
jgi:Flp pilus assembly protein TadG